MVSIKIKFKEDMKISLFFKSESFSNYRTDGDTTKSNAFSWYLQCE